jgi:hypothetical protein
LGRFFAGRQWAALLAVEDQGGQGALPINELHKHLDYPNPYLYQQIGVKKSRAARFFAFPMTVDKRRAIIDRLGKYLVWNNESCGVDNLYPALRVELGQFVVQETINKTLRYAADVGCNDDLVMSLAITLWVLIEEYDKSSPLSAIIEDNVSWSVPATLDLSKVYEERDKMIAELEKSDYERLDSLMFNSNLLQLPPRYNVI